MDISNLSEVELQELQQKIPLEMKRRETQKKADALGEVRALAKAHGFTLEELLGKEIKLPKAATGTVKIKYRHPEKPELQWTGRGRPPRWIAAWQADGGHLDDLLV